MTAFKGKVSFQIIKLDLTIASKIEGIFLMEQRQFRSTGVKCFFTASCTSSDTPGVLVNGGRDVVVLVSGG